MIHVDAFLVETTQTMSEKKKKKVCILPANSIAGGEKKVLVGGYIYIYDHMRDDKHNKQKFYIRNGFYT